MQNFDAIILVVSSKYRAQKVRNLAKECALSVSGVVSGTRNGTFSVFIAPHGSKSGWSEDQQQDFQRGLFLKSLSKFKFFVQVIHVAWGESYQEHGVMKVGWNSGTEKGSVEGVVCSV